MPFDPLFDVIEFETEMTTESVVGDRVAVAARGASVDERLRDANDLGNLLDV